MNNCLKAIFLENLDLDEEIAAFLAQDPEFVRTEQSLCETAQEIAAAAGFELYDRFERSLWRYTARLSDAHYRFGLGLRQEVLRALGAEG